MGKNQNKVDFYRYWLLFSFIIAFVPFTIGLLTEIMNWLNSLVNDKFWDLSWTIKIISYLIVGLFVALFYKDYLKKKNN